jgi:hypothetical protein
MADEIATPETTTETPAEGAPETEPVAEEVTETAETEVPEGEPEGEALEAEGDEAADEAKPEPEPEPKEEAPEVTAARKMYATATRKERKALEALKSARQYEDKAKALDSINAEFATNPLSALQKLGLTTDAVLKLIGDAPDPNDKLTQLENKFKDQERQRVDAENNARVTNVKASVTQEIQTAKVKDANGKDTDEFLFDLVNSREAYDEVWGLMLAYHAEHNVALSPLIAAARLEDVFEAQNNRSKKYTRAGKAPSNDTKPTATKGSASAAKPKTTTLTNSGSGRVPKSGDAYPIDLDARSRAVLKELGIDA